MMSSLLEWPFLDDVIFPPSNYSVLRTHALPSPRDPATIYVVRDPRDAYISLFFHRVHHWSGNARFRKAWLAAGNPPLSAVHLQDQLASFLNFEAGFAGHRGSGTPAAWHHHVLAWDQARTSSSGRTVVRYEDLRANPAKHLRQIYQDLFNVDCGLELVNAVATAHDVRSRNNMGHPQVGRSFVRRGQPGEWREYFGPKSGKVLEQQCGSLMRRLGYADSDRWWAVDDI
jgi:hypothetical protein